MTRMKDVGLLLMVVMLVLAFDCGNCNTQQIEKIKSVNRIEKSQSAIDRYSRSIHRLRRSPLNDAEIKEVLDAHNRVRRLEGASDMEIMIWSNDLVIQADDLATKCVWNHSYFPNLGENLYAISNSFTINLTVAIMAWYNEKMNYTYDTLSCQAEPCGHYTQVVWANSRELGCAYTRCPVLSQSRFINATFLVCNYRPAGNVKDMKPFKKGTPCISCATRSWWCNNGLCDGSCTPATSNCGCARVCQNYISLDNTSCSCSCATGWYGSDCTVECKDYDPLCNPTSGYRYDPSSCNDDTLKFYIRDKCPAMCKQCQVIGDSSSTKPSLLSILAAWLSSLLLYSFRST